LCHKRAEGRMWRCLETEKRTTKGQHTRHQKGDRNKGKQTHRSCSQEAEVLLNVSLADCFRQEEATTRCTEGQTKGKLRKIANRNNNDSDSEDRNGDARENLHHKKLNHQEKTKTKRSPNNYQNHFFGQEGRSDTGKLLQSMETKETNK